MSEFIDEDTFNRLIVGRRRSLYGEWLVESEEERALRTIAETYHIGCELYDRTVCSGVSPRTGEAMPVNPSEAHASNVYARTRREDAIRSGQAQGFSQEQVSMAIRNYQRMR